MEQMQEQLQQQQEVKKKASKLRILFRLAFICNIFFLVCLLIRYSNADKFIPQPLIELSAILGWFFSPVINLVVLVIALIIVLRKGRGIFVPTWLISFNLIFFISEIFYFFLS
jgi:hypothetical protein